MRTLALGLALILLAQSGNAQPMRPLPRADSATAWSVQVDMVAFAVK